MISACRVEKDLCGLAGLRDRWGKQANGEDDIIKVGVLPLLGIAA